MTNLVALSRGTELVGDYRIERVLGAGGFGITYLAEETPLARHVTIKEYFPVDFAARSDEDVCPRSQNSESDYAWGLERFIEEAQTLARFSHPNIVRVYRYFRDRNTGYIVLHFEEGQSLKAWLKGLGRPPRQQELDTILVPLLDALEVIHAADFLHRDIAPDNIMIRRDGSPVLIDFGSARGEIAKHTKTLSALVKPGYSPYEQYAVSGVRQGPWTDIYSLGATLYQAVTGKRPPDAPSRIVADEMGLLGQTVLPGLLPGYRAGFLAAIDHALQLDMARRPQSVADWRAELMAPAKKSPWPVMRLARAVAEPAPAAVALPAAMIDPLPGPFVEVPLPPPVKPGSATTPPGLATNDPDHLSSEPSSPDQSLPPPPSRHPVRARALWRSWLPVTAKFAVGVAIASAAAALQEHRSPVPANSAGHLAQAGDAAPIAQLKGHRGAINALGFTSDGRSIVSAAADGSLKIWSTSTRILTRTIDLDNGAVTAMSLEGRRAVTGHTDGTVAVWDLDNGKRLAAFKRNDASILSVTFAGDAGRVAAAAQDGVTAIWDVGAPEVGAREAVPAQVLAGHENAVQALAFATAGGFLASGSADKTIRLSKAEGGALVRIYRGHAGGISALAFTPDGLKLASAGQDGEIRIWSSRSYRLHYTLSGHQGRVAALAFAPDGEMLASVSDDGSIRLWNVKLGRGLRTLRNHTGELKALGLASDGRQIAAAGIDGVVRLYNATASKPGI